MSDAAGIAHRSISLCNVCQALTLSDPYTVSQALARGEGSLRPHCLEPECGLRFVQPKRRSA